MAEYRFSAGVIGRSGGSSATAAAAYRAGERLTDERTGEAHDYRRKGGILHREILAPDHAPAWMRDREALWNGVERAEDALNRKASVAQLARELQLNLAPELTLKQNAACVRGFVEAEFVRLGMVADVSIHAPSKGGDARNIHAHVMLTLRAIGPGGFTKEKPRAWNDRKLIPHWRERWAEHQNRALERAGRKERVDHRSNEARGVQREAQPKLGVSAAAMERKGQRTERGERLRAVKARNAEREALQAQEARRIEREKARFEGWANGQRAAQRSRQFDEAGVMGERHARERAAQDERLEAFYGAQETRERLEAIEARQRRGGLFYALSGAARRERREAEDLAKTLQDTERRKAERQEALKSRQEAERERCEARHGQEDRSLEKVIEDARERREREGWKPLPERESEKPRSLMEQIERDRARERERGPDRGRERERER